MNPNTQILDELEAIVGTSNVRTDDASLNATSHDTWPLTTKWAAVGRHPHRADVVVTITREAEIPPLLAAASRAGTPVTVRALGSSVTGQPIPLRGGIVLDVTGMERSCEVDETNLVVTVSASYNGGDLEDLLAERGYTLGHSPQSLYRSTVGGWLATLATGQFSSLYGGIEDLVVGYTVILATGERIELSASPRAAMGPDLRQLFIGSEGTLGVITSVCLKIFPIAETQLVGTYSLPDVHAGLAFMREQAALGIRPFLLRFYDTEEAKHAMGDRAFAGPVVFFGSRGRRRIAEAEFAELEELARAHGGKSLGPAAVEAWLARRFDFSNVEDLLALPGGYAETIEVAHLWSEIESLWAALKAATAPLADEVLAHFSHVYTQGTSMYLILLGRAETDEAAIDRLETIWKTTMQICLDHGAELSHHHGGGLARSPYARRSLGSAHLVLRKVKQALDPAGILNPGKLGL